MRNYSTFILSVFAIVFFTFNSCKKIDSISEPEMDATSNYYFRIPPNASSAVVKAIKAFKSADDKNPFMQNLIKENGVPIWSKSSIEVQKR